MNKCIPFKVDVVSLEAFHLATGRTEIYTQSGIGHLVFSFGTTKPPAHTEDGVELFPETSKNHIVTRLSAREKFIEIYSLYLCNADVNNIVYKVMNYPNQFNERQREGTVSQSASQSQVRLFHKATGMSPSAARKSLYYVLEETWSA